MATGNSLLQLFRPARREEIRQRLERIKLVPITNPEPATPSSTISSTLSSSNSGGQHQTTSNSVEYMDVELHKAAASDKDDVYHFSRVLERVSAKKKYSLSDIFEQVSPLGNTLLHVAVSHENLEIMQLIVDLFPSMIMKQNSNGDTAMHVAARSSSEFALGIFFCDWIKSLGGNTDYLNLLRMGNKKENTALHEALVNGQEQCILSLIKEDPEVLHFLNMKGESPLYLAVKYGHKKIVSSMLSKIRNKNDCLKGKSPLKAALARRDKDLIDIILQNEPRFINLRDKKGRTALHCAASRGYDEEIQFLLETFSASPIERDIDGLFPIHLAVIEGHIQAVQVLLQHCPHPREMLNRDGQNILHIATIAEKYDIVSYILKNYALGSLINHTDLDGNTPLHLAAINSNAMIVSTMAQDMRVDLKIVNDEGSTVLDIIEEDCIPKMSLKEKQLIWAALSAVKYTNLRS